MMRYILHFDDTSLDIELEGDFTFMDTHVFHRMLRAISAEGEYSAIHIDVRKLTSIDSTALHLLMMAADAAKKNHRSLVFENPKGQVYERLNEAASYNALHIAA